MSMRSFRRNHILGQDGAGMSFYEGSRRQRGGNLFSTIKRVVVPLFKRASPALKQAGKEAAKRGLAVSAGAIKDKLQNKNVNFQDALRTRASQAISRAMTDIGVDDGLALSQDGSGIRRRRKRRIKNYAHPPVKRRRPKRKLTRRKSRRRKPLKRLRRKAKSINNVRRRKRVSKKRRKRRIPRVDILS